jgi:DNA-binding transcriptional LysR family regulator
MIQPAHFDPLSYDGEFELMVQGHMGVWILPFLLERLRETAPLIRLRTLSVCDQPLEMLAAGELDFVLHAEHKSYPPGFQLATLGYAQPVLLARKGHPLDGKQALTWEMLAQYPHVRLIIPEFSDIQFQGRVKSLRFQGPVESLEDSEFFQRESELIPHLQTDHLYTALRVVLDSDYLFPAPPLFMEQDAMPGELIALPLPGGEEITLTYVMVSHERVEHSAAHEFMRGEILETIEQFRHRYGLPCLEDLRAGRNLSY